LNQKFYSARGCICSRYPKNIFQNIKKIDKKIPFTYSQSKRICKISLKTVMFYGLCKKLKNCHIKCLIFSTKFYLFYTRHITRRFIVLQLCGYVASEDVRANFLFQFCNSLKYIKYIFQNIESICSQEPKHHSRIECVTKYFEIAMSMT
jgi:hypothetical protein